MSRKDYNYYHRYMAEGKCVSCGKGKVRSRRNNSRCRPCQDKYNEHARNYESKTPTPTVGLARYMAVQIKKLRLENKQLRETIKELEKCQ